MIERTEAERVANLNAALKRGLISENIVNMVDSMANQFDFAKSSFIDGVANPGAKSAKSLSSKLYRRNILEGDSNFTLLDVSDIIRCSIIIDDYSQVIPLIKELKDNIPGLNGYISENATGYKGIHLHFTINGFNAEMQISTRDAWLVKQVGEEVYSKWRDFNLEKELEEIETSENPELQSQKLQETLQNKQRQDSACRKIFQRLNEGNNFEKYKDRINAVLAISELENTNVEQMPKQLSEEFKVKNDGKISNDELLAMCQKFHDSANKSQDKLIQIANKALSIAKNMDMSEVEKQTNLSYDERMYYLLDKEYKNILVNQCVKKFGSDFSVLENIGAINNIVSERSAATFKYFKKEGIRPKSMETVYDVLKTVNNSRNANSREEINILGSEKLYKRIQASMSMKQRTKKFTGKNTR